MFGIIGAIGAIGGIASSIIGHRQASRAFDAQQRQYEDQERHYQEQMELNRKIGAFNADIAERSGMESMFSILTQTKQVLGKQVSEMRGRGVELDGSPMLVLGDTITMGTAEAQSAYFNAQVQKENYKLGAQNAVNQAASAAQSAHFGATSARYNSMNEKLSMFGSIFDGLKLFASPTFQQQNGLTNGAGGGVLSNIFRSIFK